MVVSTSAIDCLERLVSDMTYYVPSGTLNPTHSLTNADLTLWLDSPMFWAPSHQSERSDGTLFDTTCADWI